MRKGKATEGLVQHCIGKMRGLRTELKSRKNNPLILINSAIICKLAVLKKHSLRSV